MKFSTFTFLAITAIVLCCSEEEPNDLSVDPRSANLEAAITGIGTPEGDPITKTIGPSGGSIASTDGVMELTIPPGALSGNTDITIQPVTNEAPGGIGLSYNLLPDGTLFAQPAKLTFHYTDEDVNGSNPFFLYIAYQDEDNTWVSDLKKQALDTIAKTISLDINHFTIFSEGIDFPRILPSKKVLKPGESSLLAIMEVFVKEGPNGEQHTEGYPVPPELISDWRIHAGGVGSLTGSGTLVTYHAPNQIDFKRTVTISAHVNVTVTAIVNGKKYTKKGLDPQIELTLEPIPPRKYEISFLYVDSVISPFYGRKGAEIPVYRDRAKFNLDLKFVNHVVEVDVSNIINDPPVVTPATKEYNGTEFTWIPDTVGVIDIDKVTLHSSGVLADSILRFNIRHKNATSYGRILKTLSTGHTEVQPGGKYGVGFGYPSSFEVDLKRHGAYFDPSQNAVDPDTGQPITRGGIHISVSIVPK